MQTSVLVRIQNPTRLLLQRMLASVLAQTVTDWELVLVVSSNSSRDLAEAKALAKGHATVRVEVRPEGELLAWSCNALLDSLGDWVAFLGQHDQLTPDALEAMATVIADQPGARVIYSDEESLGTWGQVTLQSTKGSPDPIRLRSQEYLQDLALIQKSWLITAGGFDRLASDCPTHDLYLRLLETVGTGGFAHTPARLYRRHRNMLARDWSDPRASPYLPRYDLDAVRRHYERSGIRAKIKQLNGTLDTDFPIDQLPTVTVVLVLGDDLVQGKARLAALGQAPVYQPANVQALYAGESEYTHRRYVELCKGLRYPFKQITGSLPAALNQEASAADTDLVVFLQGTPLSPGWLSRLVALTHLPGIAAAGGMLLTPVRLTEPGCPGALLEGSPWNIRGNSNQITVMHSVSVLSPSTLLVDTRKFLEIGGFDPDLPTLYGMDFTMRLVRAGYGCARSPRVQVHVGTDAAPEPEELEQLRTAWTGWGDPYGLHQLP